MQTNFNSVIGVYNPEQLEDTTDLKDSRGWSGLKDITSGSPFFFYWVSDQIQIVKLRDDKIAKMSSFKDYLMIFWGGLSINAH